MKARPEKALHPLVAAYVATDADFSTLLRSSPDEGNPVVRAMKKIHDSLRDDPLHNPALEAALKVPLEGQDPSLVFFFLSQWAYAAYASHRYDEARALVHRALALRSPRIPPEIRANLTWAVHSRLEGLAGNVKRREEMIREALAELPLTSPRRPQAVWHWAIFLARLGRLTEAEEELRWLEGRTPEETNRRRIRLARFVDAVETGRRDEARGLVPRIRGLPEFHIPTFRLRRAMLDLLDPEGVRSDGGAAGPEEMEREEERAQVEAIRGLLEGRPKDALDWARRQSELFHEPDAGITFTSLNLIRCELALGHGEAARRLLAARRERGNIHPLDRFFEARVERLAGRTGEATQALSAALASAEGRAALGRLDFEIRMALEIPGGDLLLLGREIGRRGAPDRSERIAAGPSDSVENRGVDRFVGQSPAIEALRRDIARIAPLAVPVLITGETGTGKELVARALHEAGPRAPGPFVAFNCGAIAESLLETELFGHERGAFTGAERAHRGLFEEAGAGTLLLDEIGEVSPRLQVALLRVLENGEIRPVGAGSPRRIACRIVAATNAPLERKAREGSFRRDLFYRLRRLEIRIPPLRERREDILPLARHFLDADRRESGRAEMSKDLEEALLRYDWPGNVRELRNEIERMRLMNSDRLRYGLSDLRKTPAEEPRPPGPAGEEYGQEADIGASLAGRPERRIQPGRRSLSAPFPAGPDPAQGRSSPGAGEAGPGAAGRAGPRRPEETPFPEDRAREVFAQGRTFFRRRERILQLFRRTPILTRIEIVKILGFAPQTITADLKALRVEGLVEKVEPTRSPQTHYFVLK